MAELDMTAVNAAVESEAGQQAAGTSQQTSNQVNDTPTPAADSPFSLVSELKSLGIESPELKDDRAAWQHLRTQLTQRDQEFQQARQYAQYYLANQQRFAAAIQAQEQAAAQQQQAQQKPAQSWWQAPEWKDEWQQLLTKDAQGNIVAIPGADPGLALKYQQYQNWQRESFNKILRDPIGTLKPGLEESIKPMIEQAIKQHLGQYGDQQFANQYVQNTAAQWAYQKDQNGNAVRDPYTGQPMLSPAGQRFVQYVQYAQQTGITDVRAQQQYAESMVQRDALEAFYRQHAQKPAAGNGQQPANDPDATNDQQKRAAIKGGARRVASGGGAPVVPAQKGRNQLDVRLSLGQRLSDKFKEANVTDFN